MKISKPRLLITGGLSLLGKYLIEKLSPSFEVYYTIHHKIPRYNFPYNKVNSFTVDLTSPKQISKLFDKVRPDKLIHLAALSNIDYCENHPDEAYDINVLATKYICDTLKNTRTHLIFTSSNAVFSGNNGPYNETAKPDPINYYGVTKNQAEQLVLSSSVRATVVRLTTMLGWPPKGARDNDLTYYLRKLSQNKKLYLVNDRFFNPVHVRTAVSVISKIITKKMTGIYHIGGFTKVTRYTLVKTMAQIFIIHQPPTFIPVTNDFFKNIAKRPKNACLVINKMIHDLKVVPNPITVELTDFLK